MILEDFILLGTTVPEPNGDGRVFVCSAGVSAELKRLIRIYPLARNDIPHRWHTYRTPLERNPKDTRDESWRIRGDRTPGHHRTINSQIEAVDDKEYRKSARADLLSRFVVRSIQEANNKKLSLAIIHPEHMEVFFQPNQEAPPEFQSTLFDTGDNQRQGGARSFPLLPRIRFTDDAGGHDLMLRDWGAFELQRKNGPEYFRENLASALYLSDDSSLLIGNMNQHRNSWLVISVLNHVREPESLFNIPSHNGPISGELRIMAHERDNWTCIKCKGQEYLEITTKDRSDEFDAMVNLDEIVTMCRTCINGFE